MSGYAGSLRGELTTDNCGGASYSIDIDLPPGIAGAVPKLSFGYSSLGGNGPLGMGWALSGLSVIERCPSTLAQDGFLAGVTFSDTDRLTLDQSRLVPRGGGSYFGADTVYETEIQSWHRVVPIYGGTPGRHGPDGFEVRQRNGRIFRYGATADSQGVISPQNPSIRAWYLSSITDLCGNVITFSYLDAGVGGTRLPGAITYTANGTVTARRSVRFAYEPRDDVGSSYIAGYEVTSELRLRSLTTQVDQTVVSAYALAYDYGVATGRSRLTAITRADGGGIALPPTCFGWQDAVPDFNAATALDMRSLQWGGTLLPMDISGDGRVDFVNAYSGSHGELCMTIYLAQPAGGFATQAVAVTGLAYGGQLVTLDSNGDGRMELAYGANDGGMLGITLFTPSPLSASWTLAQGPLNGAGPGNIPFGGTLVAADVDGDGLADLVVVAQGGAGLLSLTTLFSDGSSFARSPQDTTAPSVPFGGEVLACDANADGMDDIVYVTLAAGGTEYALTLFRSGGRAGFTQIDNVLQGNVPAGGQWIPMDVNADGNTDLLHLGADPVSGNILAQVVLNDGRLFHAGAPADLGLTFGGLALPASLTASPTPELLVLSRGAGNDVLLSAFRTSSTGLTPVPGLSQLPAGTLVGGNAMPLDLRGVGFSDLVYAVDQGGVQSALVMPAAGPYPDLLLTAANGVGGVHSATYAPLTDPSVYRATGNTSGGMEPRALLHSAISGGSFGLGAPPLPGSRPARHVLQRTPIPKYVVATSSFSDGIGNSWMRGYGYEDALIDHSGRGWLGFAAFITTDFDAGTTARSALAQFFPLTRMITASTVTRTADAALMTDASYAYDTPQAGSSYQILGTATATASFSFARDTTAPDTVLLSATQYDGYGNVTRVETSGSALAAGSTVVQTYATDEASWQIGLLTGRAEYADPALATLLRQDRFTFDPTNWLVTGHGRWNDVAGQWLETGYAYDRFGNLTAATDPTGAVKTTVYETDFNSFPQSETISPCATETLVQSFVHEPGFGTSVSITDAAGSVRTRVIDGLGRVTAESRTAPDGGLVETTRTGWTIEAGLLCQTTAHRLDWQSETWTGGSVFADGLGRVIRSERDPAGGDAPVVVETSYNAAGSRLSQTLPHFKGAATLTATWAYDAFGRVTAATTPAADGTPVLTATSYPRVDTATTTIAAGTPSARSTSITYGITGAGQVPITRTDNAGATTRYAYDGLGRLLTLTDPLGIVTDARYDSLDRQVATTISSQGTTLSARAIAYDDRNRSAAETTPTGGITLVRDAAQRIVEKRTSSGQVTTFLYDETDMDWSHGRLTTVLLPSGDRLRYGYDPAGNVALRQVRIDGITSSITESFLPGAQRASIGFPDGSKQTNSFGPNGQIAAVAFAPPGQAQVTPVTYSDFDALDHPSQTAYGNGAVCSTGYDVYGRLATKTVGAAGDILFRDSIRRGPTDAVIAAGDPRAPVTLTYDPVGRLRAADGGASLSQSYIYDNAGNATTSSGTAISYTGYAPVSGTGADPFTAGYDANGAMNTRSRDGKTCTLTHDDEQNIVQVVADEAHPADPAGLTSYTYDHTGRRLSKNEGGIKTYYVGPEYEIVCFPDGSRQHSCIVGETGVRDYIFTGIDQGSPPPTAGIPAPGAAYFICDHLRSVRSVLDGGANVVATLDYDPFGAVAARTGTEFFRYSFSAREYDANLGAYYFGARYYDPRLQRFLTPDDQLGGSLIDRDSFNIYAYVLNDPVALFDPTGHSWWDFAGQIILDTVMVAAGVALLAVTGGAANIAGSALIGAGIGGLSYDIRQAATGKGEHVGWGSWGIQVGIGAATGLITGGVAVGAGSILATASVEGVAKGVAMATIMAVTSSGTAMASSVVNNAIAGTSLTSGLGVAGVSGAIAGLLGGGGGVLLGKLVGGGAAAGAGVADVEAAAGEAAEIGGGEGVAAENEAVPQQAPRANAQAAQSPAAQNPAAPTRNYWQNFKNGLAYKTDAAGRWQGFSWSPVVLSSPRLVFGSLRGIILSSRPDWAKSF